MNKKMTEALLLEITLIAARFEYNALVATHKLKSYTVEEISHYESNRDVYQAAHAEALKIAKLLNIDYQQADHDGLRDGYDSFKASWRWAEYKKENNV